MKTAQLESLEVLLEHYRHAEDTNISHRAHVVLLHLKGWCVREIAEATFREEVTVSRWITSYKRRGIGSIFPGYYSNQNAAKLTKEQKKQVQQLLKDNPLPNKFWSLGELKKYISARFDVEYKSDQSYYGLFRLCNYSYKLPALFNIKRDDHAVEKRMSEIREEIKPWMDNPDYIIFAADESRIEWSTLLRRAWLRKGVKTVIREKNERRYQNFIGFLDLKKGEELLYRLAWQDQEHIIPVLIRLVKSYPDKKIVIIWDNAGFHRGRKIKDKLGENNALANITLINLPSYAPDKNPQEWVWHYGKDTLSNQVYNRFEDMMTAFEVIITGRKYPYQI